MAEAIGELTAPAACVALSDATDLAYLEADRLSALVYGRSRLAALTALRQHKLRPIDLIILELEQVGPFSASQLASLLGRTQRTIRSARARLRGLGIQAGIAA